MDTPEEDNNICRHYWVDIYGSDGSDIDDPYVSHIAFYCRRCLAMRHKTWRRDRYKLDPEFLKEFEDDGDTSVA